MAIKELYVKITGDDAGLQKALNSAEKGMKEAAPGVDSFIKKFAGPAGLAAALGVAAKAAIDTALEFDEANATIAKATGKTGIELSRLNQSFRELQMRGVEQSLDETSGALAELSKRLELSGSALVDTTQAVADFADVTDGDMKEAVATTTTVMSKWGIKTSEMPGLMDKLYVASTKTGISVESLSSQLTTGAAQFQAMGFGIDESIALLATFDRAGVNSGSVMGGMSIAIRKFADEGIDARDGLAQLIQSITDAKTPQEAFALGADKMGRSSVEFVTAVRSGKFNVEELTKAIQNSEGAVGRSAAASDTWADKLAVLQNKAKGLAAELAAGNVEAQAREAVAREIQNEFLKALETEGSVYKAAQKVTEQYGISLSELQNIGAQYDGNIKNEVAMAKLAGLTAEEMAKQAATAKSLFERGTAQFQLIQMMKDEKVQIKLNEEARAAAAAAKIEADKLEAAAYTSKLEGVQFLIKNGYIPEKEAAKELVKVKQEEIDRITQKIKSSETATPQEITRLAELTKAVKEENEKIKANDLDRETERQKYLMATSRVVESQAVEIADKLKEQNDMAEADTKNSEDLRQKYLMATSNVVKEQSKEILKQLEIQREAARLTSEAFGKIGDGLKNVITTQALKGLKDLGSALGSGKDAGKAMVKSLDDLGQAILDALPNLFLQAGLTLISNPATFPIGMALLAASGVAAVVSGITTGAKTQAEAIENAKKIATAEQAKMSGKSEYEKSYEESVNREKSIMKMEDLGIITRKEESEKLLEVYQKRLDEYKKSIEDNLITALSKLPALMPESQKQALTNELAAAAKKEVEKMERSIYAQETAVENMGKQEAATLTTQEKNAKILAALRQFDISNGVMIGDPASWYQASDQSFHWRKKDSSGMWQDGGLITDEELKKLGAFAGGTSFAPGGLALVGERGPELMKMNQGAEIVPNHNMGNEKIGGASFNFYSPIAIDVGEAKRLFIQSQRDLAFAGGLV